MESYFNKKEKKNAEDTLVLIKRLPSDSTKIEVLSNNHIVVYTDKKNAFNLEIEDHEALLDSKHPTYNHSKKIKDLPAYTRKKIHLEDGWVLTVKDRCIQIHNDQKRNKIYRKRIPGKVTYINILNRNTIILIYRTKSTSNSILLKFENNKLNDKIIAKDISPENRFYALTSEIFIQKELKQGQSILSLYDTDTLTIIKAIPIPSPKLSCIKILPDHESLVFFPNFPHIDSNKLHIFNIKNNQLKKIDIGQPILDFNILPNGKIIITTKEGNIMQLNLKHIQALRKSNALFFQNNILEYTNIGKASAHIITDYLGIQISSNKSVLFKPSIKPSVQPFIGKEFNNNQSKLRPKL